MSSSTCSLFRCGDTCIELNDSCMCGDESFGHKDNFWCCHDLGTCRLTNSSDLFNQGKRSPNFFGKSILIKGPLYLWHKHICFLLQPRWPSGSCKMQWHKAQVDGALPGKVQHFPSRRISQLPRRHPGLRLLQNYCWGRHHNPMCPGGKSQRWIL